MALPNVSELGCKEIDALAWVIIRQLAAHKETGFDGSRTVKPEFARIKGIVLPMVAKDMAEKLIKRDAELRKSGLRRRKAW